MGDWKILNVAEAPDLFPDYPGEMRLLGGPLGTEQVTLSYRRMTPGTGGKGSYGHRHRTQEEIYLVLSGTLEFKLEDEVVEVGPMTAVRIAPSVVRSVWNEGPEDAELILASTRIDDLMGDIEQVPDFWPE
jgi:mannose-6-phosphate isomerase-like protein (cupin superfamily)